MSKAWIFGDFTIIKIDEIFYQLFFIIQDVVDYVLNQGPWNFDNNLVLFCPWLGRDAPTVKEVESEMFCIHITGFPHFCVTYEIRLKILAHLRLALKCSYMSPFRWD